MIDIEWFLAGIFVELHIVENRPSIGEKLI